LTDEEFRQRLATAVQPFLDLLLPFENGVLEPEEFEVQFLRRYLNRKVRFDEDIFNVMDGYFSDVEVMCVDPRLRDQYDLAPEEVRASTRRLLERAGLL
jgi:hypothetical protein